MKTASIFSYTIVHKVRNYWVGFWNVFDSKLKLVRLQNRTKNQYFFVVWFWYGFGLVWFGAEPKPHQTENIQNGYVYALTHVPTMSTMVLYAIFLN